MIRAEYSLFAQVCGCWKAAARSDYNRSMPAPIIAHFASRLLNWHALNGRQDLPWQRNCDAYRLWVSEIMLQQTQVVTVIPYFERFIQRFNSIEALANASEDEVLHLWSGLGYYSRARNLHNAAKFVVSNHNGDFPQTMEQAIALPGIGRSTAGAILAFAYGQRHPILDGNVKRVLCRLFAIEGYPGTTKTSKTLWALADELTPKNQVGQYTQAIMDLGATLCTRSRPQCSDCPFHADCKAYKAGVPQAYPHKKPKPTHRRHNQVSMLILALVGKGIALNKRPSVGLWGGLWCLPLFDDLATLKQWLRASALDRNDMQPLGGTLQHKFTHFDLSIDPYFLRIKREPEHLDEQFQWYDPVTPLEIGLPKPIQTLIKRSEPYL